MKSATFPRHTLFAVTVWTLVAAAFLLVACGGGTDEKTDARPSVFVSIAPQAFLVREVAGDRAQVHTLLPPGQSPHSFSPTPRQIAALATARLYFRIGVELEEAVMPKLSGMSPELKIVDLRRGVHLRDMAGHHGHDEHDHATEHEHDGHAHHAGTDPHIWLSPRIAATMVETIREGLTGIMPGDSAHFALNARRLHVRLDSLDRAIAEALAPLRGRKLFVFHPSFGYFADAYGLQQVAVETGGKEPSAKQLTALIEQARREAAKVIFVQPQFSPRSARAVAEAIEGTVVAIDPLAEDYLANLGRIAEAVRQGIGGNRTSSPIAGD
jgi:zinc transport system substrate-binding protein